MPIGLNAAVRGQGFYAALCVDQHGVHALGCGYTLAGGVCGSEFFQGVASAIEMPTSTPGMPSRRLPPAP